MPTIENWNNEMANSTPAKMAKSASVEVQAPRSEYLTSCVLSLGLVDERVSTVVDHTFLSSVIWSFLG